MDIKIKTLLIGKYLGMCELVGGESTLSIGAFIPKVARYS
jgi:hypothetical protein